MTPGVASISNYGGALQDYSAPADTSTDRSATGTNPAYNDLAAMTHVAPRCWVRFTAKSAGTAPSLIAHDEMWNNGNALNTAPVVARSSGGIFTVTCPATVYDEIPTGLPGATPSGRALLFRAAWASDRAGSAALYVVKAVPTSANVITVYLWKTAGGNALSDPAVDTDIDVVGI